MVKIDDKETSSGEIGVWKPIVLLSDPPKTRWMCSLCGWADFRIEYKMRYCPNCGSYMRRNDDGR